MGLSDVFRRFSGRFRGVSRYLRLVSGTINGRSVVSGVFNTISGALKWVFRETGGGLVLRKFAFNHFESFSKPFISRKSYLMFLSQV